MEVQEVSSSRCMWHCSAWGVLGLLGKECDSSLLSSPGARWQSFALGVFAPCWAVHASLQRITLHGRRVRSGAGGYKEE
eukprot:6367019-Amphidinium_carterae.1